MADHDQSANDRGKRKNASHAFYFWCVASSMTLAAIIWHDLPAERLTALNSFYTSMTAVILPLIAALRGLDAYFNRPQ